MTRKTPMSAVSLSTDTRNDLNRLVLEISLEANKRLSVTTVVSAMLTVVQNHRDELEGILVPARKDDTQ